MLHVFNFIVTITTHVLNESFDCVVVVCRDPCFVSWFFKNIFFNEVLFYEVFEMCFKFDTSIKVIYLLVEYLLKVFVSLKV